MMANYPFLSGSAGAAAYASARAARVADLHLKTIIAALTGGATLADAQQAALVVEKHQREVWDRVYREGEQEYERLQKKGAVP